MCNRRERRHVYVTEERGEHVCVTEERREHVCVTVEKGEHVSVITQTRQSDTHSYFLDFVRGKIKKKRDVSEADSASFFGQRSA